MHDQSVWISLSEDTSPEKIHEGAISFSKNINRLWNNALYLALLKYHTKFFDPQPDAEDFQNLIIRGVFRGEGEPALPRLGKDRKNRWRMFEIS